MATPKRKSKKANCYDKNGWYKKGTELRVVTIDRFSHKIIKEENMVA
jgi:hypothetical protein